MEIHSLRQKLAAERDLRYRECLCLQCSCCVRACEQLLPYPLMTGVPDLPLCGAGAIGLLSQGG